MMLTYRLDRSKITVHHASTQLARYIRAEYRKLRLNGDGEYRWEAKRIAVACVLIHDVTITSEHAGEKHHANSAAVERLRVRKKAAREAEIAEMRAKRDAEIEAEIAAEDAIEEAF